jgi:hypothetical protein
VIDEYVGHRGRTPLASKDLKKMERIPRISEFTHDEICFLRQIVAASFTPSNQIHRLRSSRLIELGLVRRAMGGLIATPAGRMVSRM